MPIVLSVCAKGFPEMEFARAVFPARPCPMIATLVMRRRLPPPSFRERAMAFLKSLGSKADALEEAGCPRFECC
eukprot:396739-Hanusia_phi.AAC.4